MFIELLIASVAVIIASLVGIVTVWKQAGDLIEKNLNYLVSFAAGVFIVLVVTLSSEVLHNSDPVSYGFLWIILGVVGTWIIVRIFPEGHYHGEDGEKHIDARKLLIGDSLHNVGDGVLLSVAFLSSTPLGIITAVSIFLHELVQEIAEFFVLRKAGYSPARALKVNFLTASTILIGSVGGYFLFSTVSTLEIPVLGLATGALLALLLQDLIPHSIKHLRQRHCTVNHLIAIVIGVIVMLGIFGITADSHTHELGEEDHAHEEIDH